MKWAAAPTYIIWSNTSSTVQGISQLDRESWFLFFFFSFFFFFFFFAVIFTNQIWISQHFPQPHLLLPKKKTKRIADGKPLEGGRKGWWFLPGWLFPKKMSKRVQLPFNLQTFDRPRSWKAATHSRLVDSGTFSLLINGVQTSWEGSVRTHSTFSGTLKKSKFRGADLALLEDFLLFGSSEPSADCRVANQ